VIYLLMIKVIKIKDHSLI